MTGTGRDDGRADGHDGEAPPDEPRVRDLLRRASGATEAADPDAAQLRAWFGLPSFDDVAEAAKPAVAPAEADDVLAQRQKALAQVEPRLLAHLLVHEEVGERLYPRPLPARPWWEDRRLLALDEAAVAAIPTDGDWREVDIPYEMRDDLKTCTPQAFLRDLYRPEKSWYIQYQPPWEDEIEADASDPIAALRELLHRSYRVGAEATTSVRAGHAALGELRRILARPWAESKREEARRREAELLAAEAGKHGAQPPVVREPKDRP